jgi:cellulose synthase/poly-beta-1,6-N-acetylglucosamine synthase-like glycosyltransferase
VALGEFVIEIVVLLFAAFPCALFFANLRHFRRAPMADDQRRRVSVLIPARNEERSIEASVRSVLANEGVELECVVLDDGSTDATPVIVHRLAASDPRVVWLPLPHYRMAGAASNMPAMSSPRTPVSSGGSSSMRMSGLHPTRSRG